MAKLDLVKTNKTYYSAGRKPEMVTFDGAQHLTLLGQGEPAGELFVRSVEALYPLAYGIKKICKAKDRDFGVPKLEGLWWVEGDPLEVPRSQWHWKLLIRMPEYVTADMLATVKPEVAKKKRNDLVLEIGLETLNEGTCAQILHVGPYATEPETIGVLMAFIDEQGCSLAGLHHEIYLSDPRKVDPAKMKTLIRYPVTKA